jgi:hypothetical protein
MTFRILASFALAAAVAAPVPAQNSGDDYGSRTTEFCAARRPAEQSAKPPRPKKSPRRQPTRVQAAASVAFVKAPSKLGYTLFLKSPSGRPVRIDPSKSFRLGDWVRLSVESSIDGFLYVFNSDDANGNPAMIFPHVRLGGGQNYIQAHVPYEVPSRHGNDPKDQWFEFKGKPGVDRLYFVVSSDPLDGVPIEDELRNLSQGSGNYYWTPEPEVWRWVTSQVGADLLIARSRAYGQAMTQGEDGAASREIRLAASDPPPSVLYVNKRSESVVVASVDLRYGN